jgi:hypothetical protein
METLNSSDARIKWSTTFDEAFYKGPKLIEKGNRINILLGGPMLSNWFSKQYPLKYSHVVEDDIHMVNLTGVPDIFGYGETFTEALDSLLDHLTVLAHGLFEDFPRYSQERPNDIPYLLQLSMLDVKEISSAATITLGG